MFLHPLSKFMACFLSASLCLFSLSADENFILMNGVTDEIVHELGSHIDEQISPCSTFKIPLSLMGFDDGILIDKETPSWPFQEGYDDFLESWKTSLTPQTWMQHSCVWYSKILALKLGAEKIQNYLAAFEYGNQDMSGVATELGPINPVWVNSSLKISAREQVHFIQQMVLEAIPLSSNAMEQTKVILFKEDLPNGWKLFGKTGWSGSVGRFDPKNLEIGWFVGWIEKDQSFFPFAYFTRELKIKLDQRIPRVKQLLSESMEAVYTPSDSIL